MNYIRDSMDDRPGSTLPHCEPDAVAAQGNLSGQVRSVDQLTAADRDAMFALLDRHFHNVMRSQFEHDLNEKQWAIVLKEAGSGRIQGFSTLQQLSLRFENQAVIAFFSGDTIVARRFQRETLLPRLWGHHVFQIAEQFVDAKVFWFLICSGYKTWRFLPVFFRQFFPHYRHDTPVDIQRLMDALAFEKFGACYDPASGVVRLRHPTPLREGVAELSPNRLRDAHVAYFAERNPGHMHGDELVCIAEISRHNLTASGRRMIGTVQE